MPLNEIHELVGVHIATTWPASERAVEIVLGKPVHDDGRSDFEWVRLHNGDLILGVYPRGETYFEIEGMVSDDYTEATRSVD